MLPLCIMSVPCRCPVSSALPCLCLNRIFSPLLQIERLLPHFSTLMLIIFSSALKFHMDMTFRNPPHPHTWHACILKPYAGGVHGAKRAPRYLPSLPRLEQALSEELQRHLHESWLQSARRKTHCQCQPDHPLPRPAAFTYATHKH